MICKPCCQTLYLVQYDTAPLYAELLDYDTGLPLDISDCALWLHVRRPDGSVSTTPGTLLTGLETGSAVDETPPYDEPGKGGRCLLILDDDTLSQAGVNTAEVEVVYQDGRHRTTFDAYIFNVRAQLA